MECQVLSPTIRNATFGEWMALLENRCGGQVPTVAGEWPDWWADGVGSAARELAMICRTQDQALHAQTMHALVTTGTSDPYPARWIDRVWQNILLSDDHTWGAARPAENRLYVQNNLWSTNFVPTQGGELSLSYSLSVHGAPFDPVSVETFAGQALTPLRAVVVGKYGGATEGQAAPAELSWMAVSGDDSIIVSAVSRSERALVFRVEEIAGQPGDVTVSFP